MAVLWLVALAANPAARRVDPLTGMAFSLIPAGSFDMGTPETEPQREPQERLHRVTISRGFYLGVHEVTQREWTRVMRANPSNFKGCPACPVERVTYFDVEQFLERLNAAKGWPGFRLPTEAEWEYACRAGGHDAYGASATITPSRANYAADHKAPATAHPERQAPGRTLPVGTFAPNAFGLFDMSGNVWEWTSDDHCAYPDSGVTDPSGRCGSGLKVIRGGSWYFGADSARCGMRYTHRPQDRGFSLGVRLAHDAD
jgi:sulfatase modifying factor 1